ncbi:MAG TPA: nucleotide exchange factor GrpE [Coriobacteriia bacterium]|jgi:molecular chaperone GrpE
MTATRQHKDEDGARKPGRHTSASPAADPGTPELHPDEAAAGGAAYGDEQLEGDLGAELELAQRQATEHLQLAQRVQAEFENYRKRMQREQTDAIARAGQRIIEELLPVLDNLERAIDHTTAGGDIADLLKGVELVHSQFLDVFGKEGVEVDDPFGGPFDPAKEQAVGQREDPEVPDGTVVDVYQKGYVMHGKVIRPAMVVVSTGGPHRT